MFIYFHCSYQHTALYRSRYSVHHHLRSPILRRPTTEYRHHFRSRHSPESAEWDSGHYLQIIYKNDCLNRIHYYVHLILNIIPKSIQKSLNSVVEKTSPTILVCVPHVRIKPKKKNFFFTKQVHYLII